MDSNLSENIAKNLVFIDGITRCGKSLFSNVISSFEDMEHIQFVNLIEHIIPSVALGGIKSNYAKMIFKLQLNELSYNIQLSRNVNFRKSDQSGVYSFKTPEIYEKRLKLADGDIIVNRIRESNISIPFQTHDLMSNIDIVEAMDLDYKMIELYRNPIDNIYSWWTQGWGERFDNDPRSFTLQIPFKGRLLPWYCVGYEDAIIQLNPHEKCVMMGMDMINRCSSKQRHLEKPEKILTIRFEDMVEKPNKQIKRIEIFLNRKSTKFTEKSLIDARCPRVLNPKDRAKKLLIFKKNINTSLYEQLISLEESYEKNTYGLTREQ